MIRRDRCVVVVNFTPQVLRDYRVRVPFSGQWREIFNSDARDLRWKQYRERRGGIHRCDA